MLPVSFDHGQDHVVIILAVNLFAAIKGIPLRGLDTTTLRKPGVRECQPDVSYYVGDNEALLRSADRVQAIPSSTGIVNLDQNPAPNLVIEVAKTSLLDDIGTKRALYEELGVAEYWVVDVQNTQILAYAIAEQGSQRIQVMIETHSEILVNRLGQLVSEGKISPDEINIVLFEPSDKLGGVTIRNSQFNSDGYLLNWPLGFFEMELV